MRKTTICGLCEQKIEATDKVLPGKNERGNVVFDHALCRAQKAINLLTEQAASLEKFLGMLGALVIEHGGAIRISAKAFAKSFEREHKLTASPTEDETGDCIVRFTDALVLPASSALIEVSR